MAGELILLARALGGGGASQLAHARADRREFAPMGVRDYVYRKTSFPTLNNLRRRTDVDR
jgi:hypothetical protein